MKLATIVSALALSFGTHAIMANADHEDGKALADACKVECPDARNDHHAHRCLKVMKKEGKTLASGACADALKEHEEHEKEHKKH